MQAADPDRPRLLGELLVERKLLSEEELKQVLAEQRITGRRLGEIAVSLGLLSSPALSAVLAEQIGVPLETEQGFGSGLWVEIGRRHERGLRRALKSSGDPDASLEQSVRRQPEPPPAARLEIVDPEPSDETRSADTAAPVEELAISQSAYEQVVRELTEARLALELAERALEHRLPEEAPRATFVIQVQLERGYALLQPTAELAKGVAGDQGDSVLEEAGGLFSKRGPIEARRIASASPQDPVFGFRHENLVSRLTRSNWRERAILRGLADGRQLYVWLTRVEDGYLVNVRNDQSFEAAFPRLAEALAFANGASGRLGRHTRPVERQAWPPEHDVFVLCFPVVGREGV